MRLYSNSPHDFQDAAIRRVDPGRCASQRNQDTDESLREMGDWDLLLRLTRNVPPTWIAGDRMLLYDR
jgi:hypothetical protein